MLKFFGREDIVRNEEVFDGNTVYDSIELYATDDSKTGQDIGRPINNIYENQFKILSYLEASASIEHTQDGVFPNSLGNEYNIDVDDGLQVVVNTVPENYIRIPPGISSMAYTDSNSGEHTTPMVLVNTPTLDIAARQIGKILNMDLLAGRESVEFKYITGGTGIDTYKAKIKRKDLNANTYSTYYYGAADEADFIDDDIAGKATGFEIITDIYNEVDFLELMVAALAGDITKITLEPFFKITAGAPTDYYFYYDVDGIIKMVATTAPSGGELLLSTVNVTDVGIGTFAFTADNAHTLIGEKKTISTTSTDTDSLVLSSGGGTEITSVGNIVMTAPLTTITGDLTVDGTTTTVDTEDLVITDNTITLNNGETGDGITVISGEAGLLIDRGNFTNYQIIFDEADDEFKTGEIGSELQVARVDAIIDGAGIVWDDATKKFIGAASVGGTFTAVDEFDFDSQTDFDWSVRETGENPIVTSEQAMNTNRQDLYEYVELVSTEGANYQVAAGAGLIGCAGLAGITPSGSTSGLTGNLQAILNGMLNPNVSEYSYQEATTVDGDATAATTWNIVALATTGSREEILTSTLAANLITLPAGTFDIEAFSSGYQVGKQKLRIYDTTNTAVLLTGKASLADVASLDVIDVSVMGQITLSDTADIRLDHYTELVGNMGMSVDDGGAETYATIKITQRG
ncbi:MAG: hypothetical protein DRJ01_02065 [Bacteroidetes bacterium]|nr:MAG: hypothetical protein DRJ01_02065 [Bacteroidota bacterium]